MTDDQPQQFWQGVEQFNTGEFYACHDTLEALWMEATEPEKTFYQGILQIAVALYHLGNHNWRGAAILLGEGSNRLRRYPSVYGGIDVDELLEQSTALLRTLQQTEPEKLATMKLGETEGLPLPKIVMGTEE
jgi:predicted metal-dependent hydrolase